MNQSAPMTVNPKQAVALVAGHFGELAQGLIGAGEVGPGAGALAAGPAWGAPVWGQSATQAGGAAPRLALITLPCPRLETRIGYEPWRGPLSATDPVAAKAMAAARLTLAELGADGWGGEITIDRPVAPGLGAGSSTAETLGVVRAVARAFGSRLAPEREAALCLAAEGAVDPLMHDGVVLFAAREGRVLAPLAPLPAMRVVGGFAGPGQTTDPADLAFPDMAAVFDAIAAATRAGDLAALARAAEMSAAANQARNPNPAWDALGAAAPGLGALGRVVSHTGSAIGLILPPAADPGPAEAALAGLGLEGVIAWDLGAPPG